MGSGDEIFSLVPRPHRLRERKGLLGKKTELFASVLLFPGAWSVRKHRLTPVNMTIQDFKYNAFKLLMYGTLFCHLTITGIARFLMFLVASSCTCGSVVLIIFNILGFLKAYLLLKYMCFRCYHYMDSSSSTTWSAANKRRDNSKNDPASNKRFF